VSGYCRGTGTPVSIARSGKGTSATAATKLAQDTGRMSETIAVLPHACHRKNLFR